MCTARREDKITAQHNKVVRRENTRARRKRCLEMQKQKCKIKTQEHQRSPTATVVGTGGDHDTPPQEMSSMALPALNNTHSYTKAHTHIIDYMQPYARTHSVHTLRITTNTVAYSYHSH